MNKRIQELNAHATSYMADLIGHLERVHNRSLTAVETSEIYVDKFAELIIEDALAQINQEWYDLNNAPKVEGEDARAIGIRVGQKNGVLKVSHRIREHFGFTE